MGREGLFNLFFNCLSNHIDSFCYSWDLVIHLSCFCCTQALHIHLFSLWSAQPRNFSLHHLGWWERLPDALCLQYQGQRRECGAIGPAVRKSGDAAALSPMPHAGPVTAHPGKPAGVCGAPLDHSTPTFSVRPFVCVHSLPLQSGQLACTLTVYGKRPACSPCLVLSHSTRHMSSYLIINNYLSNNNSSPESFWRARFQKLFTVKKGLPSCGAVFISELWRKYKGSMVW